MALTSFHEKRTFYDPFYLPDLASSSRPSSNRGRSRWFDDFTVSDHLHILNAQSISVNPISAMHDSLRARPTSSTWAFPASRSLSRGSHRRSSGSSLGRCVAGNKTACEEPQESGVVSKHDRS